MHDGAIAKASWEVKQQEQQEKQQVGFNVAPAPPAATTLQTEIAL